MPQLKQAPVVKVREGAQGAGKYGFVQYEDPLDAEDAIAKLNGACAPYVPRPSLLPVSTPVRGAR
jgi:hypothetical protein